MNFEDNILRRILENNINDANTNTHGYIIFSLHRMANIDDSPTTKLEMADKFLQQTVRDDDQNVHDSYVNADLRKIMDRIRINIVPPSELDIDLTIGQIFEKTSQYPNSQDINEVLLMAMRGNTIMSLDMREDHVLYYIWSRCRNTNNSNDLENALITAIGECKENGSMICINGRCAKYINSLATLDSDPIISAGSLTYDAYRKQIYDEVRKIIADQIELFRKSDDKDIAEAAESYVDLTIKAQEHAEDKLKSHIFEHIERCVMSYSTKFPKEELQKILTDCKSAI